MRYAIVGTGAVGGYFGAKLAMAGHDVHFLLHSDYDYVKEHGIEVKSCKGDFHLDNVRAYRSTADMPEVDVVMVALKTTNNHLLPNLLTPLLHERCAVLLIQNGIGVEADVQAMLPQAQLLAGLAFIGVAKKGPGFIDHVDLGNINIGNYSCRDAQLVSDLLADLNAAGIGAREIPYDEGRWRKAIWNMPFNGMTVAMNTTTDRLLASQDMREVIRGMMREVIGAARACGVTAIKDDVVDKMIDMTLGMTPYSPSMKFDYDRHQRMEIEYIYSRPLQIAREHGYRMVRLEMLEAQLRMIEQNRALQCGI